MSIQTNLETLLTHRGIRLDTCSDQELMYALTAAVRELQKPMPHAPENANCITSLRNFWWGVCSVPI